VEEIATVYARALFEAAQEQGRLDVVREQLGEVADALIAELGPDAPARVMDVIRSESGAVVG